VDFNHTRFQWRGQNVTKMVDLVVPYQLVGSSPLDKVNLKELSFE
jgi:hypothetical protein